jgi:molybdate transport system ATP-binding protein
MTSGWIICQVGQFQLETAWEVKPGQVLSLFGPSGSGKTTTLRAIAGLIRPRQGHIKLGDQVVYDQERHVWVPPHLRRVGYMTQQYYLFPHLTVAQNVAYGLRSQDAEATRRRAGELLETFHLTGLEARRPSQISGGQQQRVALARALAPHPAVLLLDEPFAALDAELRRTLREELRAMLVHTPIPVILVTHDREEVLALADTIQVLEQGRVIAQGEPLGVLGQPGQVRVARLVGVENLFQLHVTSRHPQDGTMTCTNASLRLEVPLDNPWVNSNGESASLLSTVDEWVTVGIRASDVILSSKELTGSSVRNCFPGEVTTVTLQPPGYEVTLNCSGELLRAHITGAALAEMSITPGQTLWAAFKASSCFLLTKEASSGEPASICPGNHLSG